MNIQFHSKTPILTQICLSSSWGGQEMVAFEMAESFQKKGYQTLLITTQNSPLEKKAKDNNIATLTFTKKKHIHIKLTSKLRELAQLYPNMIFMSHQLSDLWMISPALIGLKNKLIGFSHTFVSYKKKNFIYKKLYSRLDHLVVLTHLQKQNILEHHAIDDHKLVVIPNAVDLEKFNPRHKSNIFENKFNCPTNVVKISLIGRLDPQKGQEEVVLAFEEIMKTYPDFQLYIIGTDTINSPGTTEKIKHMIAEKKLGSHIHLLGHCENVAELMASSDFKIMPSYSETFGRVVIEAMACGCPVLATNAGGVPDIITDHQNGLLCKPRTVEDLKEKIIELIKSPELRKSLSQNALITVKQKYAKPVIEAQIEQLF